MRLRHWQASVCVALTLVSTIPPGAAQQAVPPAQQTQIPAQSAGMETGVQAQLIAQPVSPTAPAAPQTLQTDPNDSLSLPQAPNPSVSGPLFLRPTFENYSTGRSGFPNPFRWYTPMGYAMQHPPSILRLHDLLRDGKLYLSLSDAVTLALENNYDIAIARINLDIADTDLLRARAGYNLRGVNTAVVANTLGGSSSTVTGGGGPGGTASGVGGTGAGSSGLVLSTNGLGPTPELRDPSLTAQLEYESNTQEQTNVLFSGGLPSIYTNTETFNFNYTQGFGIGSQMTVGFDNTRQTTDDPYATFTPALTSSFRATLTQHLLNGFGTGVNSRFILQAKNNRRITDAAFRQQLLYTINQVENIYWDLVSAYENEQAKERALAQSTQLTEDNRKQLSIGTLAPLDVVNSDAAVAADKQALIAAQTNLEYRQLIMKQAIAHSLNDPILSTAPIIPTDRVALNRLPNEDMPIEDLVREAYTNNPQIEQAVLNMKNNLITIKAVKNGLLPVVDAYGFYGGSAAGGAVSSSCADEAGLYGFPPSACPNSTGYGTVFRSTVNNAYPDYGVGINVTIPLRNREAQADQSRSQMEYRQSQLRLQQLYTQVRIQVINGRYALTNDRAQVAAAQAQRDYALQSFNAEKKKYKLGASTSANVLQQERNLATAENTLISDTAAYAKDRAALFQLLSTTLDRYHISIVDAAAGTVNEAPIIPGLTAPKPEAAPKPLSDVPPPPPGQ